MGFVTPEQIQTAKQLDLLTYLQRYEPDELIFLSAGTYCTRSHDSLKISNGKWHWFSRGIGGRTALDYLIKVKELPFTDAVETLSNKPIVFPPVSHSPPQEQKRLELPPLSATSAEAARYLIHRGIDWEIVDCCQTEGYLLESRDHRNAIFTGRDSAGIIRYAALRGIRDNFKGEAAGSDKRFSFCLPGNSYASEVHLFECAIDAMSYATMLKLAGRDWTQVPLLSLGGVFDPKGARFMPLALQQYLSSHPNTHDVYLHLDTDAVGRGAARGIIDGLKEQYNVTDSPPPPKYKDVNDYLMQHLHRGRGGRDQSR